MTTVLLIAHSLIAVALLGAITHQTLAAWVPARPRAGSFLGRFRSVPGRGFATAVVVLYIVAVTLGAIVYLYFRVEIRPALERDHHWWALGLFDLKEHFVSIGLALLPTYWLCWRRPLAGEAGWTRAGVTAVLAVIVWWSFLIGHILNNIRGFGA